MNAVAQYQQLMAIKKRVPPLIKMSLNMRAMQVAASMAVDDADGREESDRFRCNTIITAR